jgi:toxin ParE1/3/4
MAQIIVREDAESDIADAALWYESKSSGLGSEFLRSVDACLSDIARTPQRFPVVHRNLRRALLRRFPFGVFFISDDDVVRVVACLHVRRNPARWRKRMRGDR